MILPKINVSLAILKYKTAIHAQNLQALTLNVLHVKVDFI